MGKQIRYSEEFKEKTVVTYLQGNFSAAQLARSLGVHPQTVCHWIRQYSNNLANTRHTTEEKDLLFQQIVSTKKTLDINSLSLIVLEIERQLELLKQKIASLSKYNSKKYSSDK